MVVVDVDDVLALTLRRRKLTGMRSMFPQSRNTAMRSSMSSGGMNCTASIGRFWYSCGSGKLLSDMNITESFPSARIISWNASNEPSASPSGFSCVVTSILVAC